MISNKLASLPVAFTKEKAGVVTTRPLTVTAFRLPINQGRRFLSLDDFIHKTESESLLSGHITLLGTLFPDYIHRLTGTST